jgi:4-alpha-glucanotransferase
VTGLHDRARAAGVNLSYEDGFGTRRRPRKLTIEAIVEALGDAPASRIEPVVVAWNGKPVRIPIEGRAECALRTEDGDEVTWEAEGAIELPRLPLGYHDLTLDDGSASRLIAAPLRAPRPDEPTWGVFLPLYALVTERSPVLADFTDLEALRDWCASLGGKVVGTLPLFAGFTDEPSPYSPITRLFWNELYIDPGRTPEAYALRDVPVTASGPLTDFAATYEWKHQMLQPLADAFFADEARRPDLASFLARNPLAEEYARFRTKDDGNFELHLYAQLVAEEQLATLDGLYLDMPVGTHPQGFDVSCFDVFATGISVGAPPDGFFEAGQNWGFPPIDPARSRTSGHDYFVRCVRKLTEHASVMRIDHVMGLHRLFVIPDGMEATEGTYISCPADELYAIVCLEAQRNACVVVGEDLGTVPTRVRTAMRRHRFLRSHVLQFEPNGPVLPGTLASLNTHDTATFAGWGEAELRPSLLELARSDAAILVVGLEDLWGEVQPQNVPGTTQDERPNWRRKAVRTFEAFSGDRVVRALLEDIDGARATAQRRRR